MNNYKKIGAVFLAAGTSSRMGKSNKLLLPFREKYLVQHTFTALQKSNIDQLVIVTGHQANQIENALGRPNNFVHNPNYEEGMTRSIQTGILALNKDIDAFMICLADMPFLNTAHYNRMIKAYRDLPIHPPMILQPKVQTRTGNPVIFSSYFKESILAVTDTNGCKSVIKKNSEQVHHLSFKEEKLFFDIDRIEDYQKIKEDLK